MMYSAGQLSSNVEYLSEAFIGQSHTHNQFQFPTEYVDIEYLIYTEKCAQVT